MKTLTIIWLALATVSQAAVVVREVPDPNGFFVHHSGRVDSWDFDVNGDERTDLTISLGLRIFGVYVTGPETTEVLSGSGVAVVPEGVELSENTLLGSSRFYLIDQRATLTFASNVSSGGPWENQTGYIGFSFLSDAGRHYGWFYHEHIATGVGGYFHRYAYETEPGVAITTPEPSASAFLMAASCLLCLFRRRRRR